MSLILLANLTLAAIAILIAYHSLILQQRLDRLTLDRDTALWRATCERQRANVLGMSIATHLLAKRALLAEFEALERKVAHFGVRSVAKRKGYRQLSPWKVKV